MIEKYALKSNVFICMLNLFVISLGKTEEALQTPKEKVSWGFQNLRTGRH